MYARWISESLSSKLRRPYVHLMFGARQTGKSTLLRSLLPPQALIIDFTDPAERSHHLADPGLFASRCQSLEKRPGGNWVLVDEAQNVPSIFDSVQHLYDSSKKDWRFILCGSSARKLRQSGTNLLPGRSFLHHLYPLILAEQPQPFKSTQVSHPLVSLPWKNTLGATQVFPPASIEERLAWGSLPGVVAAPARDRANLLRSYAEIHLEEEIRREALVKDWGAFVRFLRFAGQASGQILNLSSISQETGLSIPTIKSHYQLLEDMFMGFRIPAFSGSPRKKLLSTPKFYFFDLGIRHAAAGLKPGLTTVNADPGPLFEQWVTIELWKRLQYTGSGQLSYLRTRSGAEVDLILEKGKVLIPIEIKWTQRPSVKDARHLIHFLEENPKRAKEAVIVCRCPYPQKIAPGVTALPWQLL